MSCVLDPVRSHRVAPVHGVPSQRSERAARWAFGLALLAALPAGASTLRLGEVAEVTASNAGANQQFGSAVAVDGDTLVVGAINGYGSDWFTGAAYVFTRNQGGAEAWGEVVKLVGTDTAMFDYFGHSVAISGDLLVVGAPGSDPSGDNSGAAYVFERNQGGSNAWGQVAKLTASDGAATDSFGTSVAIDGATVVVGAKYHTGPAYASGAAYLFARNQGGPDAWGQVTKLTASDASSQNAFGHAVAISGSHVAVAANQSRAVYLFARNQGGADAWGQVRILTNGLAGSRSFGLSIALDGDTLAIGGPSSIDSGAVWIHARNQGGLDNWGEVRQLTASDAATADFFGAAVALGGDRLLVGAPYNDAAAADAGALFLFERNAGGAESWGEVQRLFASGTASAHYLGEAVDLDGSTAVAGARGSDGAGGDSGSAYVLAVCKADPGVWTPGPELHASDGVAYDHFGTSLAATRDTLVVGASDDDDLGASSGAAYVLVRNQGGADAWSEVDKLKAADGSADDRFGGAVGISGDTVVVGAHTESSAGSSAGAAYVFARNLGGAEAWGQVRKLSASDAAAGDRFGEAVAIAGDLVVVGAPYDAGAGSGTGAVYLFARNQGGSDAWGELKKLTASDATGSAFFGQAVAVSGDYVLVGAPQASVGGALQGAAYLFVRNLGGADAWGEAWKLVAADGAAGDFFGASVALAGDTALVGAKSDADAGSGSGSAYVFSRNMGGANAWGQVRKLTASDAGADHQFGARVALIEGTALVGAPRASANLGAAYLFDRNSGGADLWGEVAKLSPTGGVAWEYFGQAVAFAADAAFVAAPSDSDLASAAGSVSPFFRGCVLRDFGDAPDPTYPTREASDGACHALGGGLRLGAAVDGELDGQPLPGAGGDDGSDVDDGDGVALPASLLAGAEASVAVTASAAGLLNAWIDFDADGDWLDAGEQVITDVALTAGVNPLQILVPVAAAPGATFARFRFDSGGGLAPTGSAADGEVEDYLVTLVVPPDLSVAIADSPDPVPEGRPLHYLLTVANDGTVDATAVTLTVTLPAEVELVASTPGAPACTEAAGVVTCDLGTRPASSSTEVDLLVDVLPDTAGAVIDVAAEVTLAESDPVPANNSDTEATTVIHVEIFADGFEIGNTSMWSLTVGGV